MNKKLISSLAGVCIFLLIFSYCERKTLPTDSSSGKVGNANPDLVQVNIGETTLTLEKIGENYVLEGDILFSPEQIQNLQNNSTLSKPLGAGLTGYRWPNNTVYYKINASYGQPGEVSDAISHWESWTFLDFVERTTETNYIEFINGTGCSSYLGMIGGRQYITLEQACSLGNTIHEIGHAVGLLHEHTRSDRDNYVTIHWSEIESGKEHNFQKYSTRGISGFDYSSFNFNSIMLYGPYDFSDTGNPTITKVDGSTYSNNTSYLSSGDRNIINYMYPPPPPVISLTTYYNHPQITWSLITGVSSYKIYRRDNNGAYVQIGSTAGNNYIDTAREVGSQVQPYYYTMYYVKACASACSDYSSPVFTYTH